MSKELLQDVLDAMAEFRYFLDADQPWSDIRDNQDRVYMAVLKALQDNERNTR